MAKERKVLYCIFFDGLGPVAQIPVPKGKTLNEQFTLMCCLNLKNLLYASSKDWYSSSPNFAR